MLKKTFQKKMDAIRQNAGGLVQIAKAKLAKPRQDSDFKALRAEREAEGMPNENPDGTFTEGFKARSVAAGVRARLLKGKK
jgi:hypothetical protein